MRLRCNLQEPHKKHGLKDITFSQFKRMLQQTITFPNKL